MIYDTKTVYLSNQPPILGDTYIEKKFTVKGEQKIVFDLSNISTISQNLSADDVYIFKTKADWGDGLEEYYESVFDFNELIFKPPQTIEHTYSITTSADTIEGALIFEYQNGFTGVVQLCAYVSRANLMDMEIKNLENQLFFVEDIKKLTTYVDKNNNLYNLAITPTLLTRYDSSQQDVIEIPEDDRVFLQTSEKGDGVNALSATDIQGENSPSQAPVDYTRSKFVIY